MFCTFLKPPRSPASLLELRAPANEMLVSATSSLRFHFTNLQSSSMIPTHQVRPFFPTFFLNFDKENGFDTATCIATGGGPGFAPDQCCGTYPDRFPFYSYDNTRGCCAGKTYDKDTLQCCEGGNVAVVCDGMNFGNLYAWEEEEIFL